MDPYDSRYEMKLTSGQFSLGVSGIPSGWFHLVVSIVGPSNGEGLRVYYNGVLKGSDSSKGGGTANGNSGQLVIGRRLVTVNGFFASVTVDELTLWSRSLTAAEITAIHQMV